MRIIHLMKWRKGGQENDSDRNTQNKEEGKSSQRSGPDWKGTGQSSRKEIE